jgi:hypothetical protein
MITETIEWFTPEEKTPADEVCIGISQGLDAHAEDCFYDPETREWFWLINSPYAGPGDPPKFWAYKPKGPR